MQAAQQQWAPGQLTRVPYWVYQDPALYAAEQRQLYQGRVWNFLCLEAEIANAGDYVTTFVGELPVIVVRDTDGAVNAFENRCAHRGALISIDNSGNARDFTCIYHAWNYDLKGNVQGIAFRRGVNGKGGMPDSFRPEEHAPRKLRVATVSGLVFGTLSAETPPIEAYLGDAVLAHIRRVLHKPVQIIGRFTQALHNNWKLYFENVKDTYHASLLHLFLPTFNISRLTQGGGTIVSEDGGSHVSWATVEDRGVGASAYQAQGLRTESKYKLEAPYFLDSIDEIRDGVGAQILTAFPGFAMGHVQNTLAVRQIHPKGVDCTHVTWTYLGFSDDAPELRRMRLRQLNLVGPAGYISLEDGAVVGFVQRAVKNAPESRAVLEMGGQATATTNTRATEAAVRGFWKAYRACMGL